MVEEICGLGFCKRTPRRMRTFLPHGYLKTHQAAEFLAAMCSAGAGLSRVGVRGRAKRGDRGAAAVGESFTMEYTARTARNESARCVSD